MMIRKRPVGRVVKRAAWLALGAVVLQILVAASLVEMRLPPVLQSLHQAVGTLVWIAIVIYATLAARAAGGEPARLTREPDALEETPSGSVARRREAAGAAATLTVQHSSPASVPIIASEPEANARMLEIERAGRAYEAALSALVAEADAAVLEPEPEVEIADAPPVASQRDALPPEAVIPPAAPPETVTPSEPPPEPPAVALPEEVVPPVQSTTAPKRPHSVAVIVARGADF
ncbi:MAG: hypothetical protein HOQ09_03140 [Gemmatimonadaceae bacterium]|nr:hypothetical protein [Gemmatimonadaceae bacterium]